MKNIQMSGLIHMQRYCCVHRRCCLLLPSVLSFGFKLRWNVVCLCLHVYCCVPNGRVSVHEWVNMCVWGRFFIIVGVYCMCRHCVQLPTLPPICVRVIMTEWWRISGVRGLYCCSYCMHFYYALSTGANSGLCLSQMGEWEYPWTVSRQRELNSQKYFFNWKLCTQIHCWFSPPCFTSCAHFSRCE